MTRERFIELVQVEQESLRRFLLALCNGDRELADDLAQETLIKAWLASDGFVERYKFSTWLFKIAYNTFLDYKKRPFRAVEPIDETHPSQDRPDDAFKYEDLYFALSQLAEKTRMIILLYYMQGYSVIEIAKITGSNPVAVRQHLSRGRKQLKKLLEDEEK
jgi:RNA polymerase sigma-70 factor (ECF subfamily)